jgi:hypothetical protein
MNILILSLHISLFDEPSAWNFNRATVTSRPIAGCLFQIIGASCSTFGVGKG